MGRKRNFLISENLEDLENYKLEVKDYKSSQQLKCLLLIKSGTYSTLEEVATHLDVHYSTIQRWLKVYRDDGIEKLLSATTRNKPSKYITPEIHQQLESRLRSKNNPFSGYVEVQQWLLKEHNVAMGYKWLWSYMTTKMNAKLKVPRKVNIKKQQGAEQAFFKTTQNTKFN